MKTHTLLIGALLLVGAVAAAPAASAHHEPFNCAGALQTVDLACTIIDATGTYIDCYIDTAPINWASTCV